MILAGESSGSMSLVLRRLAEYFDSRDKLVRKVRGAMAYPIFVGVFIFVIVTVMALFVIPQFRGLFDSIKGKMPAFTEAYLSVYDGLMNNMVFILPSLVITISFLIWYGRTATGHEKFSRLILSTPLLGKIILHSFMSLFCRTISTLLSAGVSVLDCFDIMGTMSKNDVIRHAIFVAKENVVKGSSISFSLATTRIFPNLVMKMVRVGEQAGSLPEVLGRTADYYQRRVESMTETLTKLLEPLLIIIVGSIVLVTVVALYLPVFTISDVAK